MRSAILAGITLLAAAATAHANARVVVMTDLDDAGAFEIALAGRGTEVTKRPAPEGALRLDRAAAAQRSTAELGAVAAVWIDHEAASAEVCVVSADGHLLRHAPLPAEEASPRVFAAIAASLLDEVLEPPPEPAAIAVDVHVDLVPQPPAAAAIAAPPRDAGSSRPHIELGPMLTSSGPGIDAEITFSIAPSVRVGLLGIASTEIAADVGGFGGVGLELRRVGHGARHFDVGILAGAADTHEFGEVSFAALRIGLTWELAASAINVSLSPALIRLDPDVGASGAAWLSVRWEVPV